MTIPLIPLKITRTLGRGGEANRDVSLRFPFVISNNESGWIPPGQLSRTEQRHRSRIQQRVDDGPGDRYYPPHLPLPLPLRRRCPIQSSRRVSKLQSVVSNALPVTALSRVCRRRTPVPVLITGKPLGFPTALSLLIAPVSKTALSG